MDEPLMILVAGPYRSGTNDDPALIEAHVAAMTRAAHRRDPDENQALRDRFTGLIGRDGDHRRSGRPCGRLGNALWML